MLFEMEKIMYKKAKILVSSIQVLYKFCFIHVAK